MSVPNTITLAGREYRLHPVPQNVGRRQYREAIPVWAEMEKCLSGIANPKKHPNEAVRFLDAVENALIFILDCIPQAKEHEETIQATATIQEIIEAHARISIFVSQQITPKGGRHER